MNDEVNRNIEQVKARATTTKWFNLLERIQPFNIHTTIKARL